MFKTICCLEVIDKLTNNHLFLTENFESEDGYLEQTSGDIQEIIKSFNNESELRHEYLAIDVFCVLDEYGDVIWQSGEE